MWQALYLIHLVQVREQRWVVVNFRFPRDTANFLTNWANVSFSRRNFLHGIS